MRCNDTFIIVDVWFHVAYARFYGRLNISFFFSSRLYFPQNELSNVSNKISRRIWKFGSLCREIERKKRTWNSNGWSFQVSKFQNVECLCARVFALSSFFPYIWFFLSSSLSHSKTASCVHENGKKVRISGEREMKSNQSNAFAYNCL